MDTPLLLAAHNNRTLEVVKFLVGHGADIQARSNSGSAPLEYPSHDNEKYLQELKEKLSGRNSFAVFGRIIKFKDVALGNKGRDFWIGKTAEKCTLVINGKPTEIPVGTRMNDSGFAAMIFPVDSMLTVGENKIVFAKDEKIHVSYNAKTGHITTKKGVLAKDMTLMVNSLSIPFGAKRLDPEYARLRGQASLHFHDNGSISEGYVIANDFFLKVGVNEITFKGDEIMEFDKNGGISKAVPATDVFLRVGKNSIVFRGGRGNSIATYPNGNIRSGRLARDVSLPIRAGTISFRKDQIISFYEDGTIESGTVNDEITINVKGSNRVLEKQKLYFKQDGSIETIYDGYKFKKTALGRES
ncbi:MAG: ankyrin repeat domain-containing protein [Geobacteraceae bacterium]|nr:ankyrin repeat domain-containing protein [Geobacteraceae bacterium]